MPPSEAEGRDLYNVLAETIGPQHAGVLMSYMPERDLTASIDSLRSDMNAGFKSVGDEFKVMRAEMHDQFQEVWAEFRSLRTEMAAEFKALRVETDARFDRIFLGMIGGFASLTAAMIVLVLTG